MENFDEFCTVYEDRYNATFLSFYGLNKQHLQNIIDNKDENFNHSHNKYIQEQELKEKRIKLLYEIYTCSYNNNEILAKYFSCIHNCHPIFNQKKIFFKNKLRDNKRTFNDKIILFILDNCDDKLVSLNYAKEVMEQYDSKDEDLFIEIDTLMKKLLTKPHSI